RHSDRRELDAQLLEDAKLFAIASRCAASAAASTAAAAFDVADTQRMQLPIRRPGEGAIHRRRIEAVEAVNSTEDQCTVFDRTSDRADLVHAPRQRHATMTAHAAIGGPQAGCAAAGA